MNKNTKAHLYILTDGTNTKIGITENLEKRIKAYNTHNPNYKQYRIFDCDIQEARRIEAAVKSYYKDKLSSSSKEWFQVPPEQVCGMVTSLFNTPTESPMPIAHGLKMPEDYSDMLYKISCQIKQKNWISSGDHNLNREIMTRFGELFQLGIPHFNLDADKIIVTDFLSVDINHYQNPLPFPGRLTKEEVDAISHEEWETMVDVSHGIEQQVKRNSIQLPFEWRTRDDMEFFELINLPTGYQIAFATARVVFPWIENMDYERPYEELLNHKTYSELLDFSKTLGLNVFRYDEWSPIHPKKTGLLVLMQKTPIKDKIKMFNYSFRRWVIENCKILEQELHKYEYMLHSICHNSTFPLHIQNINDIEDYCECFGFPFDQEEQQAYGYLLDQWKKATA
ncbi:GIY-YIG nuclease family protein [Burkholderia contaminans]|uniref:GIY-YIG nuclease family protein n=1 Tax=Burkholderia contaminans TaxID=488447 RepID=UPI00158F4ABD|nr:GIY-YIG nuclease family protein [Burkholderia contaminans]